MYFTAMERRRVLMKGDYETIKDIIIELHKNERKHKKKKEKNLMQ